MVQLDLYIMNVSIYVYAEYFAFKLYTFNNKS